MKKLVEGIVGAAITAAASIICQLIIAHSGKAAQNENRELIEYKIDKLTERVDKHNNLIERTYKLEEATKVLDERVRVANHRIEDLEHEQAR